MAPTRDPSETRGENGSSRDFELEGMESSNLPYGQGTPDAYHYAGIPSHVRYAQRLLIHNERNARGVRSRRRDLQANRRGSSYLERSVRAVRIL